MRLTMTLLIKDEVDIIIMSKLLIVLKFLKPFATAI